MVPFYTNLMKIFIFHCSFYITDTTKSSFYITDTTKFIFHCSDNSLIRVERLEYHIREELNKVAPRAFVILHPLKVLH